MARTKKKEIDFGVQVICTQLITTIKAKWNDVVFNEATCRHREEGHIGTVAYMFPHTNCVHVIHQEYKDGDLREFLTAYHVDEIEPFSPPEIIGETPLAKAIKLVQITRE